MRESLYKRHLVVGMGEVGSAIYKILSIDNMNLIWSVDKDDIYNPPIIKVDAMHICFPYLNKKDFEFEIEKIRKCYMPDCIIIHSTVPVGTCDSLDLVHSPVIGNHPDLVKHIKVFTKYFGGSLAQEASHIYARCGLKVVYYPKASITEAMKLWCTAQYGFNIILQKCIYDWCKKNKLPFEIIYKDSNNNYNDGYRELELSGYCFANLKEISGPIGGHCIIPNLKLLGENPITDFVTKMNNQLLNNKN